MSSHGGACVHEEEDLRQNAGNTSISKRSKETSSKTSEKEKLPEKLERDRQLAAGKAEAGAVSGQMLPRGRVKKGKTDKGALDFATRRPVVTSRSCFHDGARRWWAEE